MNQSDSTSAESQGAGDDFPDRGRLAAIDFGTVRVGIAVCDPDWILASPVEVYVRRDTESDADYFRQLATIEKLTGLVVGLPVHCDRGESQSSSNARAYAKWLGSVTSLPVRLFDERFSTASANEKLSGAKLTRKKKKNPRWLPNGLF